MHNGMSRFNWGVGGSTVTRIFGIWETLGSSMVMKNESTLTISMHFVIFDMYLAWRYVLDPEDETIQITPKEIQIASDRGSFSRFQGNFDQIIHLLPSEEGHLLALRNKYYGYIFVVFLPCRRPSALRKKLNFPNFWQNNIAIEFSIPSPLQLKRLYLKKHPCATRYHKHWITTMLTEVHTRACVKSGTQMSGSNWSIQHARIHSCIVIVCVCAQCLCFFTAASIYVLCVYAPRVCVWGQQKNSSLPFVTPGCVCPQQNKIAKTSTPGCRGRRRLPDSRRTCKDTKVKSTN